MPVKGELPDPWMPGLVHATDGEGLVCRFEYDSLDWPSGWWARESRAGEVVTCMRCVGLRK